MFIQPLLYPVFSLLGGPLSYNTVILSSYSLTDMIVWSAGYPLNVTIDKSRNLLQ